MGRGARACSGAKPVEHGAWFVCVVAAATGGAGTRHLINADVLTALGPHGYLVNVGRGTVVDTQALLDALRAQRLGGQAWMSSKGNRASRPSRRSFCNATTWWSRRMSPGVRRSRGARRPR